VLIDTPEESCDQLVRSGIERIAAGLYSHWHPDHTNGRRMWETRNADYLRWPATPVATPVYLPPYVEFDFGRFDLMPAFRYMESMGWVELRRFDAPIELGGWRISPLQLAVEYAYGFLFDEIGGPHRRVLICTDELFGWTPPQEVHGVDVAVLPAGLFQFHPLDGRRLIPEGHPIVDMEAMFTQTLDMVRIMAPKRVVFAHLEEPQPVTPPELEEVARRLNRQLRQQGTHVTFARDMLVVELGAGG
jgi:phosphoribosyl 1,2-cyclic phosphate phosphodiesterase